MRVVAQVLGASDHIRVYRAVLQVHRDWLTIERRSAHVIRLVEQRLEATVGGFIN